MAKEGNGSNQAELDTITVYQSFALLLSTIMGVGILSLQRGLVKESGHDAIWIILVGGLLVMLLVYIITRLMERFPGKALMYLGMIPTGDDNRFTWTKWMFLPFLLLAAIYFTVTTGVVVRTFGEVLISAVYMKTPLEATILSLLAASIVVAANRPVVIARFNEFLLPLMFLPVPLVIISLVQKGEWLNLLPLFRLDWDSLIKGVFSSLFAYSGFLVIVVYMARYQQPKKAVRPHMWAVGIVVLIYGFLVITAISVFGIYEIQQLLWPTLEEVKVIAIPGKIFERLESGVLAIWMLAVFTTIINLIGALVDLVVTYFNIKETRRKWVAWGTLPVIYSISVWPPNLHTVFQWSDWIGMYELVLVLLFILVFSILAGLRGRRKGKEDASSPSSV